MKTKHFLATLALAATFAACVSSESDKLNKAREMQEKTAVEATALDSTIKSAIQDLSSMRDTMSTDSTLAADSIRMVNFVALKNKIAELELLSAEFGVWRNSIKMLPAKDALAKGAKNPFGNQVNDAEVEKQIADYATQLSAYAEKANSLRAK
jgi:hypothetical protein